MVRLRYDKEGILDYIVNFHNNEVYINNGIVELNGFLGGILWGHCCHYKLWQHEKVGFSCVGGATEFFTQPT